MSRKSLLQDALRVLVSPAHEQLEHLTRIGLENGIDELALEYNDIAAAAEDMRQCSELTETQYWAVRKLDRYLSSISGKDRSDLWTADALSSADEWKEVRRFAKKTLDLLDQ
jgi:hypothetical protein